MPSGVPAGVSNALSALIPAIAIIVIATIIHRVFAMRLHTTAIEEIYKIIPIAGHDRFPWQRYPDVLCGTVPVDFRHAWFYHRRRHHERAFAGKQLGKSGDSG